MLVQAAWSAIRTPGRLQARYSRLVRRMGGDKNPAAKKKAIVAIAHTLLKIAYSVLRTGTPYQDLGADFYTRRQQPAHRHAWLEKQLRSLHPGCTVTVTVAPPAEGPPPPGHVPKAVLPPAPPSSRRLRRRLLPCAPRDPVSCQAVREGLVSSVRAQQQVWARRAGSRQSGVVVTIGVTGFLGLQAKGMPPWPFGSPMPR